MKKTIQINIAGIVFNIDDDAFETLRRYLDTIRSYFSDSEGCDEIMADIEARIADLLTDRIGANRNVVSLADIDFVIATMGKPEDYLDEEEANASGTGKSYHSTPRSKKLYRDPDRFILGGVCSGIGHYFGTDAIWFRLAFLVSFFGFGTGLLVYIILWIIVPKAVTAAEKLEMRGEPVNVSNIGRTIENEFTKVSDKISGFASSGEASVYSRKAQNTIERVIQLVVRLLTLFVKALGKLIGGIFILIGGALILALIISLFGLGTAAESFGMISITPFLFSDLTEFVFASNAQLYLMFIGIAFVTIIPLVALIFGGIKLLTDYRMNNRSVGWGLFGTWILGILFIGYSFFSTISKFKGNATISKVEPLNVIDSDTLYVDARFMSPYPSGNKMEFDEELIGIWNETNFKYTHVDLDIKQSPDSNFQIMVDKLAKGSAFKEAEHRAEQIEYTWQINQNNLDLDNYLEIPLANKYRIQKVSVNILVPTGKTVFLSRNLKYMLDDVDNTTGTFDHHMVNNFWSMGPNGLECDKFTTNKTVVKGEGRISIQSGNDTLNLELN